MSKQNKITVCRTTLNVFKLSFLWPAESEETNPSWGYKVRIFGYILITLPWCLSLLIHFIKVMKYDLEVPVSEDVAFLVAFSGVYFMVYHYVKNQTKIAKLLVDLSNFDQFGIPPNHKELSQKLSLFSILFYGYTVVGIIFYNGVKLINKKNCDEYYLKLGYDELCGFMTNAWTPFNAQEFPVFYIVLIYIFFAAQFLLKCALMISYKSLEMGRHIISRIDHLNSMIVKIFDDPNPVVCTENLRRCYQYHLQIINLSERLDEYFKDCMFAHLVITGVICGCLENQGIKSTRIVDKFLAMLHFVGWIFAVFVACLGGQLLINAGLTIPEAIYNSKWYNATTKLQKDLLFMLARSQKGMFLRAGGFGVLSFPLFVAVVKMSYSILAVLKSQQ